jgi:hypothetical protein
LHVNDSNLDPLSRGVGAGRAQGKSSEAEEGRQFEFHIGDEMEISMT